jgi:hypothetical protein
MIPKLSVTVTPVLLPMQIQMVLTIVVYVQLVMPKILVLLLLIMHAKCATPLVMRLVVD